MFVMIMKCLLLLLLVFPAFALAEEQGHEYIPEFVSIWLQDHQFKDYKIVDNVLKIESADLEIDGAIYDVQEKQKDKSYLVETRLSVRHKGKPLIEEYVAAFGKSPKDAFVNSLYNLCQTTLHPIYGKLINQNDPHLTIKKIQSKHHNTTFYYSGLGLVGDILDEAKSAEIEQLVLHELAAFAIDQQIHSAKLVVGRVARQKPNVTLTLDGLDIVERTSSTFQNYAWPETESFYLAKLFVVLTQQ